MIRVWLAVVVSLACGVRLPAAVRPNVVVIVLDDFGQRDCGCYGSTYYRTPNIDRLAKDGLRFTHAYAACPVCSPTRAALLTGKYPARLNLTDWLPGRGDRPDQRLNRPEIHQQLPLEETTIAESLKAAGYVTAHCGKWHLGGDGFGPTSQGFDINIAGDHTGTPLSYFAPYRNKNRTIPGLENAPDGEYLTDRLAAEAVKLIASNKSRPFFLYLPHYAVHTPLRAKPDIQAKYSGKPAGGQQSNPIYAAMVESADAAIGRVLQALDDKGLSANTLVIFTSDNGGLATGEGVNTPATSNAPLREGKGWLYEGGVRVPLIVRGPGVKPGVTDVPVCSVDMMPTVLDLCGIPANLPLDGVSLRPVLAGGTLPPRPIFWHYPHYANQGGKPGGAVRDGNLKLVEFYETGRHELFDVVQDLSESRNLAAVQPEKVKELAAKLDTWRVALGAKMPTPNPNFVPNPQSKAGTVTLHARSADIHGVMLRYEPLPHKNTLGFWVNAGDYATWDFTLAKPGAFAIEVLQGCGKGHGGSEVAVESSGGRLTFRVKDTGGFQNFEARTVGVLTFDKPGRHTLALKPVHKAGVAVMDVRQVLLKPAP